MFDLKQCTKGRKVIVQTSRVRMGKEELSPPIAVEIVGRVSGSQTMITVKEIEPGMGWDEKSKKHKGYQVAFKSGFPYFRMRSGTPHSLYESMFEPIDELDLTFRNWARGENKDFGETFEIHRKFIQKFDKDEFAKLLTESFKR